MKRADLKILTTKEMKTIAGAGGQTKPIGPNIPPPPPTSYSWGG